GGAPADRASRRVVGRCHPRARGRGASGATDRHARASAHRSREDAVPARLLDPSRLPPPHGGSRLAHHCPVHPLRGGEAMYFLLSLWVHATTSLRREEGQTTAEYALVILAAAAIAVVLIAWARSSGKLPAFFDNIIDTVIGDANGA